MVSSVLARGSAVDALAGQTDLTPEKLLRFFSGFSFELSAEPQDSEIFLQRKRGDCDDFASLANRLLTLRGYTTKLVVVMMQQQTHVVCYVKEARGFLDFNHRRDERPVVECSGALEDIADKVAGDFRSHWMMASEFKYEKNLPVYLDVVFPSARAVAASYESAANAVAGASRSAATNIVAPAMAKSTVTADLEKTAGAESSSKASALAPVEPD
jgi:hypothetical protein